jgi:16S rRNA (cytidine1402-2'-O)-methyltransferase
MKAAYSNLYLIPTPLSEGKEAESFVSQYQEIIKTLSFFFVENKRSARAFLKNFKLSRPILEIEMLELSGNITKHEIKAALESIADGKSAGVISEAGCPCVADPGALVVQTAHQLGIRVKPLIGPSSILLALMASGLNGQKFHFSGYLPIKDPERTDALRKMQADAKASQTTQIIIETAYRADATAEVLIRTLAKDTSLCIATDITGEKESIMAQAVSEWRKSPIKIGKLPTIFLFL